MKVTLQDIMKALVLEDVSTSIHYDKERNTFYLDLETRAKSDLHLYEDGIIRGRYNYENDVDLDRPVDDIVRSLGFEFSNALQGRTFGDGNWFAFCDREGISYFK
jgi:hypothetical protein